MANTTAEQAGTPIEAPPTVEVAAERLLEVLPTMFRQLKNESREAMREAICDIGDTQFMIIHVLSHSAFTMGDLAERLMVSTPTVSRMVENLVTHHYVDRQADPLDRRKVWLRLTPAGHDLVAHMEERFREVVARFLKPLDADQLRLLIGACDTLEMLLPTQRVKSGKHSTSREEMQ